MIARRDLPAACRILANLSWDDEWTDVPQLCSWAGVKPARCDLLLRQLSIAGFVEEDRRGRWRKRCIAGETRKK